jgi:carboxylesterase
VVPGAEPYSHDGRDVGILLCHGFTGCTHSVRGWGERLAAAGYTVRAPLLPGHGTTWQDMNRTRWTDWYACVEAALADIRSRCRSVVVGGLSMGGALALRLAQEHPDQVDGLVLVNPAVKAEDRRMAILPVMRLLIPSTPGIGSDIKRPEVSELAYDRTPLQALYSMTRLWKVVVAELPAVTQPVLIFRSPDDHVVPASSTALIKERIGSADVTEVLCEDSYHVATLDNDADLIAEGTLSFVQRVVAEQGTPR